MDAIRSFRAAQRGEDSADEWVAGFDEVINSLERFPEHGSVPTFLSDVGIDAFRQLPMPPDTIFYQIISSQVFVLLIAHTKRDFQSLLQERLLRT